MVACGSHSGVRWSVESALDSLLKIAESSVHNVELVTRQILLVGEEVRSRMGVEMVDRASLVKWAWLSKCGLGSSDPGVGMNLAEHEWECPEEVIEYGEGEVLVDMARYLTPAWIKWLKGEGEQL